MRKVTITAIWYEHDKDFRPNYYKRFTKTFTGSTANEAFSAYIEAQDNHDCYKYTPMQIYKAEETE